MSAYVLQHGDVNTTVITGTGAIFDLDGTLVDTLDDITDSMNEVLGEIDRPPVPRDRMRSLVGEGIHVLIERATGIDDPEAINALVARYGPVYRRRMLDKSRLYPGVPEMLDMLTVAQIPMCILSNKPHEFTVPMCHALMRQWSFADIRGHVPDVPRKPDPTAALDMAGHMHRIPLEVYFIGDSDTDILTAHNAGMNAIAVTWGLRDLDVLQSAAKQFPNRATVLVNKPSEIVDMLLAG